MSDSVSFHDGELGAAVADLTPQQRAVVALHYLDDLPVAEVAAAMSLSEGAVKYHLHQARGRLRATLGPDQPDHQPHHQPDHPHQPLSEHQHRDDLP